MLEESRKEEVEYRVLGIDPGLADTGYALIRECNGTLVLQEGGLIRTNSQMALTCRLREIYEELMKVMESYKPSVVAVEDLYTDYRHPGTAVLMGHARGVCLLAAARYGLEVINYSPARVKKSLTGNGRASKGQVKAMVRVTLNLREEPGSEHVADAIAIALCHLRELKFRK